VQQNLHNGGWEETVTREEQKNITCFIELAVKSDAGAADTALDVEADAIIRALFVRNPEAAYHYAGDVAGRATGRADDGIERRAQCRSGQLALKATEAAGTIAAPGAPRSPLAGFGRKYPYPIGLGAPAPQ
jgi:hypothetical protein